jgi:hypothetical protein
MDETSFIESLKLVLRAGTIKDVSKTIENPPGKRPNENLINLSRWFNSLNEEEKNLLRRVIELSVDSSIFGFLSILDGVRTIENSIEKGCFELYYKKGESKTLLNDESNDFLHDLYNSQ